MRKFLLILVLLAPALAWAQGPVTVIGTNCTPGIDVSKQATIGMQVTGSWSGTIQPEASIGGQAPVDVQVVPSTSSTAQSTITGNGVFTATVSGYSTFYLCGDTVTGTATVYFNVTQTSSLGRSVGGSSGGGTGGKLAVSTALSSASTTAPTPLETVGEPTVPAGINPVGWILDSGSKYFPCDGVSEATDATNGPASPGGSLEHFCRTWFTDLGVDPPGGKNAFVVIDHGSLNGTVTTNQNRALWVNWQNPASDSAQYYAGEALQAELDWSGSSASPEFSSHIDSEMTAVSVQLQNTDPALLSAAPGFGINGVQSRYFRSAGAGTYGSGGGLAQNAVFGLFYNGSSVPMGSNVGNAVLGEIEDDIGSEATGSAAAFHAYIVGADRFPTSNYAFLCDSWSTNAADFCFLASAGTNSQFGNVFAATQALGSGPAYSFTSANTVGIGNHTSATLDLWGSIDLVDTGGVVRGTLVGNSSGETLGTVSAGQILNLYGAVTTGVTHAGLTLSGFEGATGNATAASGRQIALNIGGDSSLPDADVQSGTATFLEALVSPKVNSTSSGLVTILGVYPLNTAVGGTEYLLGLGTASSQANSATLTNEFTVDSSGNVVAQGVYSAGATPGVSGASCLGAIAATNGLVTTCSAVSDPRLKVFHPSIRGLSSILQLQPIDFRYNSTGLRALGISPDKNSQQTGFNAANVKAVMPEAVGTETHGGVDYLNLPQGDRPIVAALVKGMQQQQREISQLRRRLKQLEAK